MSDYVRPEALADTEVRPPELLDYIEFDFEGVPSGSGVSSMG